MKSTPLSSEKHQSLFFVKYKEYNSYTVQEISRCYYDYVQGEISERRWQASTQTKVA